MKKHGQLILTVLSLGLILLLFPLQSNAAIAVIDTNDAACDAAGWTCASTITISASADYLIVTDGVDATGTPNTCTWNGDAMTRSELSDGGSTASAIFYLPAPSDGEHTLSCVAAGYIGAGLRRMFYISFSGAAQEADEDTGAGTGGGYSVDVSVTTASSGSYLVSTVALDRAATDLTSTGDDMVDIGGGTTRFLSAYEPFTSDKEHSYSFGGNSCNYAVAIASFKAAAGEEPPAAETRAQVTSGVIWF